VVSVPPLPAPGFDALVLPPPLLESPTLLPSWSHGITLTSFTLAWRPSSSASSSRRGRRRVSGSCPMIRRCRCRLMATLSPLCHSTSAGLRFPPPILSGAAAPLRHRAIVPEPQWGLAHHCLRCIVRGVLGGQAPLQIVEILLHHFPAEEEGEERGGPIGANRMHKYPPPRPLVI
jgi:hypothetical protein